MNKQVIFPKLFMMLKTYHFRMLCTLEGSYLVQKSCSDLMEATDSVMKHEDIQSLSFSCSIPNIYGRGFIEVTN